METSSTLSPVKQALLEQRLKRASHTPVRGCEIPKRPDCNDVPLSFAQRQMWMIDRMTPGNPAYNVPVGYRIRGALNVTALEDSVNEIIKRHEVLRTTFVVKDGDPFQLIHPALTIKITFTQLDHLPSKEREDRLQALASEESVRSFDLSRLPLIRVSLFKLADAEHVVIINVHHIVADGLSIGLILDELDTFYRAYTSGGEDPRPPDLALQYADFAQWQRQTLANEAAYANQIEFWRKQLGGGLPVLELPADMRRPALQSFKGSNVFFNIPTSLAEDLRLLGAREGCTFFMTLLAAFQVLLQRYTGADDMVIGTPVGARTPRELEPLIGNFLNMAALRCDLSGNPTFLELLRRTRDTTLNAFSNVDLPFEAMIKHVTFKRDPSRNPIFQTLLQVLPTTAPRIGDLDISSFHFDLKFAQFDLSLLLYEDVGGYSGRFEYCTDLFEAQTIRRLCGHYDGLLHAIVRDPGRSISMLPLLTGAERNQLLVEWNDTKRDYAESKCLHRLFEAQAERTPDAVAVTFEDKRLAYRELNQRANQLAHYLRRLGVGPDVLVGICMERSLEMIVGLLGVLKAGGAYVPLDPEYPKERLGYMMKESHAPVLLTQRRLVEKLPEHSSKILCLDNDWKVIGHELSDNPINITVMEHLAYVIYTSGSTGNPKGVMIPHGAITNHMLWMQETFPLNETDRVLQKTPISFDASVWECYAPLIVGARCVMARPGGHQDGGYLAKLIGEQEITALKVVPSLLRMLLDEPALSDATSIRRVFCGGEALTIDLQQKFHARLTAALWNLYGPTETTIDVTVFECKRDASSDAVPIGRPIANTEVYILDSELKPTSIGVAGELYVGGASLARGYLNRPDLTAEKFICNPFSNDPDARLYGTGDWVRYRSDGNIMYLGRIDNQVKIRGFRIELGEIEAVLNQYPGLRETLVTVREEVPGDKRLVAYIVPNREPAPTIRELRNFLKQKLPNYMVPSAYVLLDSLPLTLNGKVDRRALPDPGRTEQQDHNEYVAPRDETETVLCKLWGEILKVDRVGINDDFFAIGGHSLLAAKLFSRLDEHFGRSLPLGVLFSAPTVRLLAEYYRTSAGLKKDSVVVALRTSGTLRPLFAVPGVFGNVVGFADLARELGSEQPFYGLQSVGLDGAAAPLDSIEAMAKLYVNEIRSVQACGPYAIIGACFGATVAYEMARHLLEVGEEVAFLGLLSPTDRDGNDDNDNHASAPRAYRRTIALGSLLTDRLRLYLKDMQGLTNSDRVKYLTKKILSLGASIADKNRFKGAWRELNQIEVYRANLIALDCYQRKSLHGRLGVLEIFQPVLPITELQESIDWNQFWKGCTKVHHVGGKDSGDMLSGRNAPVIAELLSERLRAAFAESRQPAQVSKGAPNQIPR
jgi:amino acid adenylation domain-containing protein